MNKVMLIGRLTKDPDLRYTPGGTAVASFTLAVERNFANQQGKREADFINIVAWRKLAELAAEYLKKGRQTAVSGRIQTRNYENDAGQRVYVTEVVVDEIKFLDGNRNDQNETSSSDSEWYQNPDSYIDISDEDLPF